MSEGIKEAISENKEAVERLVLGTTLHEDIFIIPDSLLMAWLVYDTDLTVKGAVKVVQSLKRLIPVLISVEKTGVFQGSESEGGGG